MRYKFKSHLFLVLMLLASFLGCEDDNESLILPEDQTEYYIDSFVSTFKYDDSLAKWIISPSLSYPNPFVSGDEEGSILIVENKEDSFKQFEGKTIVVGGKYKKLYSKVFDAEMGLVEKYYSFIIEDISIYEATATRAVVKK